MSRGSKAKLQQGSRHSTLLSPLENERLEVFMGRRCSVSFDVGNTFVFLCVFVCMSGCVIVCMSVCVIVYVCGLVLA